MRICDRAINFIQIIDCKGTVRICGWIKNNEIGSLSESSMYDIWHGEAAGKIREKLMKCDYSDCLIDACPYCAMDMHKEHFIELDELPEYPPSLYLAFEEVCNYRCTSCTTPEVMRRNDKEETEWGYHMIEEKLRDVLPYVKHISANGRGELFASPNTLNILANWKPNSPTDECSVSLETNGSLFDEKHWKQIENLGEYKLSVAITVMSFNEKAYQYLSGTKLPISVIENNLRYVKELREKGVINHLELATVYQERNFRYLPEFTRRCIEEFGADEVRLRPYMPWGSRHPAIEWFFDIRNPEHPYYSEFVNVMKDPVFLDPKVMDWGGGRLSEANHIAPWEKPMKKEMLIRTVLDIEKLMKSIPLNYHNRIAIYGLSDSTKVMISRMKDIGVQPVYILDRACSLRAYDNIRIYDGNDWDKLNKDVAVIVTVWNGFKEIRDMLCQYKYMESMIFDLSKL